MFTLEHSFDDEQNRAFSSEFEWVFNKERKRARASEKIDEIVGEKGVSKRTPFLFVDKLLLSSDKMLVTSLEREKRGRF